MFTLLYILVGKFEKYWYLRIAVVKMQGRMPPWDGFTIQISHLSLQKIKYKQIACYIFIHHLFFQTVYFINYFTKLCVTAKTKAAIFFLYTVDDIWPKLLIEEPRAVSNFLRVLCDFSWKTKNCHWV